MSTTTLLLTAVAMFLGAGLLFLIWLIYSVVTLLRRVADLEQQVEYLHLYNVKGPRNVRTSPRS